MNLRIPLTVRRAVADVTVHVDAPPADVYDYLVDPRNRPEWQVSLREIRRFAPLGDGPGDVGTSWTDITVIPGLHPRMEVVKSRRPERWVEVGQWAFVDAALVLAIESAADDTSTVSARAVFTLPTVLAPILPVLSIVVPPAVRADLDSAARVVVERRSATI